MNPAVLKQVVESIAPEIFNAIDISRTESLDDGIYYVSTINIRIEYNIRSGMLRIYAKNKAATEFNMADPDIIDKARQYLRSIGYH